MTSRIKPDRNLQKSKTNEGQSPLLVLAKYVNKIDFFGEKVAFHIKAADGKPERTYNSISGALLSIAIIVLTCSYAYKRFTIMKEMTETNHIHVRKPDFYQNVTFAHTDTNFNIATGFIRRDSYEREYVDPTGFVDLAF